MHLSIISFREDSHNIPVAPSMTTGKEQAARNQYIN